MTINLPDELENSIRAAVDNGRFASVDDAMAEAARMLLRELDQGHYAKLPDNTIVPGPDPIWGCMRDDAELLDEIVAEAYRQRREETWRELDL